MAKKSTGHLSEEVENQNGANSDAYEFPTTDGINSGDMVDDSFAAEIKKEKKKPPKHLWHSALALILERGRPVSRTYPYYTQSLDRANQPIFLDRAGSRDIESPVSTHGKYRAVGV